MKRYDFEKECPGAFPAFMLEIETGEFIKYADHLAALPKVWDAETIKDAPEGVYRIGWTPYGNCPFWASGVCESEDMKHPAYARMEGFKAFGPIPQPPEQP